MAREFKLQDPGEGIHEAEIREICVSEGDSVADGDTVLVAETDKAAVDIPTPFAGTVQAIKVAKDDIVSVGDVLMVIDDGSGDEEGTPTDEEEEDDKDAFEDEDTSDAEKSDDEAAATEKPDRAEQEADDKASGTDKTDREESETESKAETASGERATPAVRGVARDLGVDLGDVSGSGSDGRILESDVRNAASGKGASKEAQGGERIALRSVRRATARRVTRAWRDIPHAVHHDVIDITALEAMRRREAEAVEAKGGKLTLTPLLLKALSIALGEHPRFNASLDTEQEEIVLHDAVHIGVAVDTDRGLLVPVVRDVADKNILDIAVELTQLADRVRDEGAKGDMLKGGTFTLTNVGAIGGAGFSPIINPPQVAIFGAARAELRQVLEGNPDDHDSRVMLALPVCVAFDHRVVDGADAARFMNTLKELLGDPADLLLRS